MPDEKVTIVKLETRKWPLEGNDEAIKFKKKLRSYEVKPLPQPQDISKRWKRLKELLDLLEEPGFAAKDLFRKPGKTG